MQPPPANLARTNNSRIAAWISIALATAACGSGNDGPDGRPSDDAAATSCAAGAFDLAEDSDPQGVSHLLLGRVELDTAVTRIGLPMAESGELSLCVPDDVVSYTIYVKTGEPEMPGVFMGLEAARGSFGLLDVEFLLRVAAHECGHWWGLFHTTNYDGTKHDHLGDTPECTPAQDRNGDGQVVSGECADLDGSNIMFWTTSTDAPVITDDQRAWISGTLP